eukprot:scaffold267858_cov32-Tisochrysis_lutea.AAC.2
MASATVDANFTGWAHAMQIMADEASNMSTVKAEAPCVSRGHSDSRMRVEGVSKFCNSFDCLKRLSIAHRHRLQELAERKHNGLRQSQGA